MTSTAVLDVADDVHAIEHDGITSRRAVFPVPWVDRMHRDVMTAFEEARSREGGAVGRGPERWYVEVHPEQLSGFVELADPPLGGGRL